MKSKEMKKCLHCQKEYPKTSEYFWSAYSKARGKSYLRSKCKKCSYKLDKEYRKANAEKFRETQRRWTQSPKGAYKSLKNSTRGYKVKITQQKFMEWYKSQPKKCYYCGIKENQLQLVSDKYNNRVYRLTVDRADNIKGYVLGNLKLCCLRCNHIKGDFFTQSEMEEIGRKYIQARWKINATRH